MIDVESLDPATFVPLTLDLSLDDGETPFFTMAFQADDRIVACRWEWSGRQSRWFFSASFADDGSTIVQSQVVECLKDLFEYAINRPAGALVPLTFGGSLNAPGLGELGGRVGVYYLAGTA